MRHPSKQTTDNSGAAKQLKKSDENCDRIGAVCRAQAQLLRKIVEAAVKELRRGIGT